MGELVTNNPRLADIDIDAKLALMLAVGSPPDERFLLYCPPCQERDDAQAV